MLNLTIDNLVCRTKDYAFCHIPKNGGTNFKHVAQWEGDKGIGYIYNIYNLRHQIPSWFESEFDFHPKEWICITRNPYSRMVSWWAYSKQRANSMDSTRITRMKPIVDRIANATFEEFVNENYASLLDSIKQSLPNFPDWQYKISWKTTSLQLRWVLDVPNMRTFPLENPTLIEEYTGLPFTKTHKNTTKHEEWNTYYTDALREKVYIKYKADFEQLGYTP